MKFAGARQVMGMTLNDGLQGDEEELFREVNPHAAAPDRVEGLGALRGHRRGLTELEPIGPTSEGRLVGEWGELRFTPTC